MELVVFIGIQATGALQPARCLAVFRLNLSGSPPGCRC